MIKIISLWDWQRPAGIYWRGEKLDALHLCRQEKFHVPVRVQVIIRIFDFDNLLRRF